MIQFILNKKEVNTNLPEGTALLDFIRYHQHLTGTKIGCREGDCGACTILTGEIINNELVYRSATSCLMALGNAKGKHIVTIEGLNMDELNPIQQAMSTEGATQCGFCTPGFVVSLAGYCLSKNDPSYQNAIASIDGNICRCTGYKSIEKAAGRVNKLLAERKGGEPVLFATLSKILPGYFNHIKERLKKITTTLNGHVKELQPSQVMVAGGTDLYVQKHEELVNGDVKLISNNQQYKSIYTLGNRCMIGGTATVTDLVESTDFNRHFHNLAEHIKLVSSTPIRNMATVAGNFVNASPIGDLTIFFLALNAHLILRSGSKTREVALRNFYKGYKQLDKKPGEMIEKIWFEIPPNDFSFNFEKVSKRTHLDIASVNTAINLVVQEGQIITALLAAGGVGPVPLFLKSTSEFLIGKFIDEAVVHHAIQIALTEISPISDARGSAEYKTLLLSQLIKAHFIKLIPALQPAKLLYA